MIYDRVLQNENEKKKEIINKPSVGSVSFSTHFIDINREKFAAFSFRVVSHRGSKHN